MAWFRSWCYGGLACWVFLTGTTLAEAQESREVEVRREGEVRTSSRERRARELLGAKVTLKDDESVGTIEDMIVNEDGRVDYLVVRDEGRYFLVPWEAARINFERRVVSVPITRERFREVPTFTRERFPDLSDRRYVERVRTFYDLRPATPAPRVDTPGTTVRPRVDTPGTPVRPRVDTPGTTVPPRVDTPGTTVPPRIERRQDRIERRQERREERRPGVPTPGVSPPGATGPGVPTPGTPAPPPPPTGRQPS